MKKHLFDHFVAAAAHHATQAKCCKTIGARFSEMREMSKAADSEAHSENFSEACEALAKEFQKMSDSHVSQGESCAKFADLLQATKTISDDELSKLVATQVSGIAPPNDDNPLPPLRAVSRAGAPALAKEEGATLIFSQVFGEN